MANEHKGIVDYFSLWGPRPIFGRETGMENQRQVWLFAGVILGAITKTAYDLLLGGIATFDWRALAIALIASIVIFPQLYYSGGLNRRKLSFAHWTFAFQNGFFWSVAFQQLAAGRAGAPA